MMNNLETPGEDIGEEIAEEDDEHQVFFAFTDGAFSNPTGNGNIDNASDPINYNDQDDNGNPVGLSTSWTAGDALSSGVLHQQAVQLCLAAQRREGPGPVHSLLQEPPSSPLALSKTHATHVLLLERRETKYVRGAHNFLLRIKKFAPGN